MSAEPPVLLWGFHPVREALRAGRRTIHTLFMVEDKAARRGGELLEMVRGRPVEVRQISAKELTRLVGHDRHQGFAAAATPYAFADLETVLPQRAAGGKPALLLVLDQVVDPQNLGAVARTALCAGVQGIVIPKDRSASPSPAASKASAGALEHMPVVCESNLTNVIKVLKQHGIWIAGADRSGHDMLYDLDLTLPLAVVIGGEEKGLRPLVRKQCDMVVSIPQNGTIGSLNASAAAAIILYEIFRQRLTAGLRLAGDR